MKKIASILTICFVFAAVLFDCSGYNKIIRDHLANAENYQSYDVTVTQIYYSDENNGIYQNYTAPDFPCHDIYLKVQFHSLEDISGFLGGTPNPKYSPDEYQFNLMMLKENAEIAASNGLFESISLNSVVSVRASDLIYMDGDFFYIAQLTYNGTEYLSFADGIHNIINRLNQDKSLF